MTTSYSDANLAQIFNSTLSSVEEISDDLKRARYLFPMETINLGYFLGFVTVYSEELTVNHSTRNFETDAEEDYKYYGAGFFSHLFTTEAVYQAFSDYLDSVYMFDPDIMEVGSSHVKRRYPITSAAWLWSSRNCIFADNANPIPDIDTIGLALSNIDDGDPSTSGTNAPESTTFGVPANMSTTYLLDLLLPTIAGILNRADFGSNGAVGWPNAINYRNPYHPNYQDGTTPPPVVGDYDDDDPAQGYAALYAEYLANQ